VDEVTPVRRISMPSREAFESEYLATGTPIIIQGALANWKAMTAWTHDYLRATIGSKQAPVSVPVSVPTNDHRIFDLVGRDGSIGQETFLMTIADYVSMLEEDIPPQQRVYLQQLALTGFPELAGDFEVPEIINPDSVNVANMWFGADGNVTALHYDQLNNLLAQVAGRKRLVLYDPLQWNDLYPRDPPLYHTSHVQDADRPDYDRFPKLREARRLECVVEPGEMLFLPALWAHQVYSLGECMSVNFFWRPLLSQYLLPSALTLHALAFLFPRPERWRDSLYPTDKTTPLEAARHLRSNGYASWQVVGFLALALELHRSRLGKGEAQGTAAPAIQIVRWRRQGGRAFSEKDAVFRPAELDALMESLEAFILQQPATAMAHQGG